MVLVFEALKNCTLCRLSTVFIGSLIDERFLQSFFPTIIMVRAVSLILLMVAGQNASVARVHGYYLQGIIAITIVNYVYLLI